MNSLKAIKRLIEMYQSLVLDITDAKDGSSNVINKYKLRIDKLMQEVEIPFVIVPSDFEAFPKFLALVAKDMNDTMPAVSMNYTTHFVPAGEMATILHNHQKEKGETARTYLEEVALAKAGSLTSLSEDVHTKFGKIFSYVEGKLDDDEVFIYMQDLDNLRVAVIRWLGIFNFMNTSLWWVQGE